jgi:hypothetical protein
MYASDLHGELLEIGHDLFRDRETMKAFHSSRYSGWEFVSRHPKFGRKSETFVPMINTCLIYTAWTCFISTAWILVLYTRHECGYWYAGIRTGTMSYGWVSVIRICLKSISGLCISIVAYSYERLYSWVIPMAPGEQIRIQDNFLLPDFNWQNSPLVELTRKIDVFTICQFLHIFGCEDQVEICMVNMSGPGWMIIGYQLGHIEFQLPWETTFKEMLERKRRRTHLGRPR